MVILGIDPGTATTGYGIVKKDRKGNLSVIDYGCIVTSTKKDLAERLKDIYTDLEKIIKKYNPNAIAIEELFFYKNIKTAIKVGHARGIALLCSVNMKKQIFEYTPLQIKQAVCGYGRADKKQMQKMVKLLLNFKKIPKPDDAADALACAICHANSEKLNKLNTLNYLN